ncbi:hypothetical protein E5C33_13845 [Stenotrophomonas maltophilia]|uniref:hypothetical protein n=1 Tax=Stenotrophomonas maltophilia TaxID=40324 RepID=UPI001076A4DB|nr:hypothetical protein [Stenotrophomonas maltophilia]TFZ44713.1 hypothetical protein E5C33_13845 [Stenotrophomonas maltophilia]
MKRTRFFARSRLTLPVSRSSELVRARQHLQERGWPRLQMALIVALTGAAGFLASHLLRLAGVDAMLLRYPMAVLLAYGVFLLLMWIWIRWRRDVLDGLSPDVGGGSPSPHGSAAESPWSGVGGRSGGGGASASWNESAPVSAGDGGELPLAGLVEDEAGLPLLAILGIVALVATVVLASVWVVWSAPVLMAELLVDAAIAGGLYRRMQGMQEQGWWRVCVSHTMWPLLGLLVFFTVVGWLAGELAPGAVSLAQAFRAL